MEGHKRARTHDGGMMNTKAVNANRPALFPTAGRDNANGKSIQISLLSMPMRIRKSVFQGYQKPTVPHVSNISNAVAGDSSANRESTHQPLHLIATDNIPSWLKPRTGTLRQSTLDEFVVVSTPK
jgi:hypothetical protein